MITSAEVIAKTHTHTPIGRLKRLLQEPLLHFLILGGTAFAFLQGHESTTPTQQIVLSDDVQRQLVQTFTQQFGRAPTAADTKRLLDQHLREEIMVREALALGLDREDEIIRRRLVQKYEFLQQDLTPIIEPSDAQLRDYYASHSSRYQLPVRATFTHIFFSPDAGDARAKNRAQKILSRLNLRQLQVERAPELGDPFQDLYDYAALGAREIERLFGPSELVNAVLQAPVNKWSGPYRSGFGWHLIYVSDREATHIPKFEDIGERVQDDYVRDLRSRQNEAAFARVAAKYSVRRTP
jgi:parvulin-like peptidyl-prolyl isomerase